MAPSSVALMKMPRDFLVSLLFMLGMKACAQFDSAMSEKNGRGLLLEMMGSGDVWYEGSKDADDFIKGDRFHWVSKRRLSLLSLSYNGRVARALALFTTSQMIVKVARRSRRLKALYLAQWMGSFPPEHMAEIAARCPDLETLDLSFSDINDALVIAAVSGMHKLKTVNLSGCSGITNASLMALSSHCPHIVKATFSSCNQITDEGLVSFSQGCSLIEDLNLSRVNRITDIGIKAIANGCKFIKSLDVSFCDLIIDESIKLFAQKSSLLQKIYMKNCNQLDAVG
jgi:hypothetical protein